MNSQPPELTEHLPDQFTGIFVASLIWQDNQFIRDMTVAYEKDGAVVEETFDFRRFRRDGDEIQGQIPELPDAVAQGSDIRSTI